jgi:hypothetical protein
VVPRKALFAGKAIYDCGPLHVVIKNSTYPEQTTICHPELAATPTRDVPASCFALPWRAAQDCLFYPSKLSDSSDSMSMSTIIDGFLAIPDQEYRRRFPYPFET